MGNSFIFDDEEPEQPEEMGAETGADVGGEEPGGDEGGNNRTFLIAVGVLGGVVLLALLCLAVYAGFILPSQRRAAAGDQAAQLVQNTAIAAAATQTAIAAGAGQGYTVQAGDTLAAIAARFGIALEALRNANPGVGDTPAPGTIIVVPIPVGGSSYTVQQGDTLAAIAARLGIALEVLRNANAGVGDTPAPGTIIIIPGLGGGSSYTVQQGDTLIDIAGRFGLSPDDLLRANPGLAGAALTPGMVINIPSLAPAPAAATSTPVVVFSTSTPIVVATTNPITATVAAAYTQAALAQLTVIPTSTALGAVPSTGFADEVGLPVLFIAGAVFLVIIFLVRRMRTAR